MHYWVWYVHREISVCANFLDAQCLVAEFVLKPELSDFNMTDTPHALTACDADGGTGIGL